MISCYHTIPCATDEILSVLDDILPLLDDMVLYKRLSVRLELGNYQALIGSTNAPGKEYLLEKVEDDDSLANNLSTEVSDNEELEDENDDQFLDEIFEGSMRHEIDLDEYLISDMHAK
jgi:hypothetical protein